MADLVVEIVDYIEKDLPVSVSAQIQSEIGMTIKESTLQKDRPVPDPIIHKAKESNNYAGGARIDTARSLFPV